MRIEAHGVRGTRSKPWRRTFKSDRAYALWLERNEADVEVHGTRRICDQDHPSAPLAKDTRSYSERYHTLPGAVPEGNGALPELVALDESVQWCKDLQQRLEDAKRVYRARLQAARERMRRQWTDSQLEGAGLWTMSTRYGK